MDDPSEQKRKRERSPSYPAISLGLAVEKAKELYSVEKSYLSPVNTILHHWGYSPKSGAGLVAIAALLKFGLLEDEGSGPARKAKITELGQRVIRDTREESPDRARLLREAALRPAIHRVLWEKFGAALPSDSNLHHMLIFEYGFTDLGANEFIRQFKATIAFARLSEEELDGPSEGSALPALVVSPDPVSTPGPRWVAGASTSYAPSQSGRVLPIPIMGSHEWPALYLPDRITEADWNQMIAVLQAMKPGIVTVEAAASSAHGRGDANDATVQTSSGDESDDQADLDRTGQ